MDCISEDEWGDVAVMGERLYRHREHWQGLNGGGFSAEWNFISLKCSGFSGGLYSHSVVSFSCLDIILPIRGGRGFREFEYVTQPSPPTQPHARTNHKHRHECIYMCTQACTRIHTACVHLRIHIHTRTHTCTHPLASTPHIRRPRTYNIRIYTLKRVSKA